MQAPKICNACETVAHCSKHGCIPMLGCADTTIDQRPGKKTTPSDLEIDALIAQHWPAFATVGALPLRGLRAAFRDGLARWGAPAAVSAPSDVEKDAARYRWLREQGMLTEGSRHPQSWRCVALLADMGGEHADAAIDDAMLAAAPQAPTPDEMSPDFTDKARAALLWVLWHHQGASSPVGQPIRFALGMGQHDRLNDHQLREAKRWEALHPVNPSAWAQGVRPLTTEQITALWVEHGLDECDPEGFARRIEAAHCITGATHG